MGKNLVRFVTFTCLLAAVASGQFNSAIQGTVTDKSGASVPDAKVVVTQTSTGVMRETATSSEGVYRVLSLGPGDYRVVVERTGFLTAQRDAVSLAINETVRADFTLDVGGMAERVTVTDRPPVIETEQGRISGRVDQVQLKELPLNTRNVFNLLALQPGVTGRGISQGYGAGSPGDSFAGESAPDVNSSGGRREANNYTVDDTSVNGMARSGVTNITPSPDSVAEVRVVSNNFSAVDGRSSGAQIQVITKGGTNEFHGSASYYFQNNTLSARSVFDPLVPVYRRHLFGYTIGGPIIKNRTFFFHSYDAIRQSGGATAVAVVETPELRDFVLRTRPNSIAAKFFKEFAPTVDPSFNLRDLGSPARGANVIGPADGIPDMGSARFLPKRTRSGNQYSIRIDHELRPGKDRLYGNFFRTNSDSVNGTIRPTFDLPVVEHTTYGNLNWTHIFGPNVVNEARAGVMRLRGLPPDAQRLDIPGITVPSMSLRPQYSYPRGWAQTNYQYKDILSWIRTTHSIKTGFEIRRMYGWAQNTPNYIPRYDFANILDFADDEPIQMARLVDPRTGEPATVATELRLTEYALFVNDDWKVRRNLTLNIGLRYENFGSLADKEKTLRSLVFGQGDTFSARLANGKMDIVPRFHPTDNKNFAPRFGFAWDITGKGEMSLRGGYGISYDRLMNLPAEDYRRSPPLRATANLGLFFGTPFTYSLGELGKPYNGYPVDPALRLGLDERNGIRGARVDISGAVDPNLVSPYVHNWFLGLQRSIWGGMVVEANYLGSAGHHLHNVVNVNRYAGDLLDGRNDGFNPSFASLTLVQSTSNSIYHGGTLQVRRPFGQGFTLSGAFTYGKSISDTDSAVGRH